MSKLFQYKASPKSPHSLHDPFQVDLTINRSETGSAMLFFIACVIPVIMTVMFLGFDVGNLLYNRGMEQKLIDQTAMFATQHLPYKQKAVDAVVSILSQQSPTVKNHGVSTLDVSATDDTVEITLSLPSKFSFAEKLGASSFPDLQLKALARIQPKDVAIFFDSSNYLSPAQSGNLFWGKTPPPPPGLDEYRAFFIPTSNLSESPHWKPATFFKSYKFAGDPQTIPNETANVRTQQCFNPAYSAIKEAAVKLYYANSMFTLNSVGVFSGPSSTGTNSVYRLREVREGGFPSLSQGEAVIENHSYGGLGLRDSHCLTAAEIADAELKVWRSNYDLTYQEENLPMPRMYHAFPYFSTTMEQEIMDHNGMGWGMTFTNHTTGEIIPGRARHIALREAVWARRTHRSRQLDIRDALHTVVNSLAQAPPRIDERGALLSNVTRTGILLLGHMPRVFHNGLWRRYEVDTDKGVVRTRLRNKLQELDNTASASNRKINLYIFLMRHYNMYPSCLNALCPDYIDDHEDLHNRVKNWNDQFSHLKVNLVRVAGVNALAYDLASYLPFTDQVALLGH